jgi:hypothetical protein
LLSWCCLSLYTACKLLNDAALRLLCGAQRVGRQSIKLGAVAGELLGVTVAGALGWACRQAIAANLLWRKRNALDCRRRTVVSLAELIEP